MRQAKYRMLFLIILLIFLTIGHRQGAELIYICYDSSLEGFRLNATIFMAKVVAERIDCVMECATNPCCRSINYKKTMVAKNELNCEMLHNVVYNVSEKAIKENSTYDHVYLFYPKKEYNSSCLLKNKFKVKDDINSSSDSSSLKTNQTTTNIYNSNITLEMVKHSDSYGTFNIYTSTAKANEENISSVASTTNVVDVVSSNSTDNAAKTPSVSTITTHMTIMSSLVRNLVSTSLLQTKISNHLVTLVSQTPISSTVIQTTPSENPGINCTVNTTSGDCCVFPFYYHGDWYESCTTAGFGDDLWCATTRNYDVDGKYGNCVLTPGGNCTVRTKSGDCCVFPFYYYDQWYQSCTMVDEPELWCATTINFDKDRKWGFCDLD